MKHVRPLFLTVILLFCSNFLYGQAWSGVLGPRRAIDWSHAGATIQNRTTICQTLSPGVTAAQINSAIASCPAGQVVYLNAGTYNLSGSIVTTTSNVTLRGAGPDQTLLVFSATSSKCSGLGPTTICVWNGDNRALNNLANQASWTAGYAPSTTQITLFSTTNLQSGSLLILSQQDDASDTGNVYVCQTYGADGDCSQEGTSGNARVGWGQMQTVQVTNVQGSTVTINPGIYAPQWSAAKTPVGYWSSSLPISGFGIENLSIDFSGAGAGWSGVMFWLATNCWVKNARTVNNYTTGSSFVSHVGIYQSTHITVRDSYMYGSNPASEGYGAMLGIASADCLVENNISQHTATGYLTAGNVGTVFGYNYAVDNYYTGNGGAPNWQQFDAVHHNYLDYYILWEGHEGIGFDGDDVHGTSAFVTMFRSYLNGRDPATQDPGYSGSKNEATTAYIVASYNRYYNLVGSVLGTQSYHTRYIYYPSSNSDCGNQNTGAVTVINPGWSAGRGAMYAPSSGSAVNCPANIGKFDIYDDTSIYNGTNTGNLMLWGNYAACTGDSNCNAVRWQASENSSVASTYPGLTSPSQTLPASFYYSAAPSWWPSTIPWPPIGPDVTSGNVGNVGGHVNLTPAANCYLNVMGGKTDGSSGLLTFNAYSCYTPAPPANVTAVAH
jgi:hypothetical protein